MILLIMMVTIFVQTYTASAGAGKKIPDVIQKLIFENSKFTEPIIVEVQKEDRAYYEYVKEHPVDNSLIPQLIYTWGYQNSNKRFLSFLIQNGYATVESLERVEKGWRKTYHFLLYTGKLKNLINNPEKPELLVAYRSLKSIDYTNEYKADLWGIKIKFYALTFTYTSSRKIGDFPSVSTEFNGKAKAYLDPDDGKWKLDSLELNDRGEREYLDVIENNYEAFKVQEEAPKPKKIQEKVIQLTGEVISVDEATMKITVKGMDKEVTIVCRGCGSRIRDIRVSDKVVVKYAEYENENVVKSINIKR
jgi:hypothetical protein